MSRGREPLRASGTRDLRPVDATTVIADGDDELVAYRFPSTGGAITSYRLTSSGDTPARDPASWTFEGCAGTCRVGTDDGWVILDSRTNETFSKRLQAKTYAIAAPAAYAQVRLRITANKSDPTTMQLGELEVF